MAPVIAVPARFLRIRLELHPEGVVVCNYFATRRLLWSEITAFGAVRRGRMTMSAVQTTAGDSVPLAVLSGIQNRNALTGQLASDMAVDHLNDLLAQKTGKARST
jgi:hypothetical protein